ncbi:MAG: cell division protein ZapB [Deltaproteobacteria bacterium]|nr:cell division protein ZapB [Deltaproteobacteria bacterium]
MKTEEETSQYRVWNTLNSEEETDQFQLLEQKIDKLITTIKNLKTEKESLKEKLQIQEEKSADLTREMEGLKAGRDKARQRIVSLLEKIEQIDS